MEPKKVIQPVDRLQHIFNDVLEDLEQTIRRTWAYQDLEEVLPLQEALAEKLASYRELYTEAMEAVAKENAVSRIPAVESLTLSRQPGGDWVVDQFIKESLQNMEERPPAEKDPVPCEYCDGAGGTPSPFEDIGEFTIPCIACDGSGRAPE